MFLYPKNKKVAISVLIISIIGMLSIWLIELQTVFSETYSDREHLLGYLHAIFLLSGLYAVYLLTRKPNVDQKKSWLKILLASYMIAGACLMIVSIAVLFMFGVNAFEYIFQNFVIVIFALTLLAIPIAFKWLK